MRDPAAPPQAAAAGAGVADPTAQGQETELVRELRERAERAEARLAQNTRFYGERERVHLEEIHGHREFRARLRRAREPPEEGPPEADPEQPPEDDPGQPPIR